MNLYRQKLICLCKLMQKVCLSQRCVRPKDFPLFWLIINHPAAKILFILLCTKHSLFWNAKCFPDHRVTSICCSVLTVVWRNNPAVWQSESELTEERVADIFTSQTSMISSCTPLPPFQRNLSAENGLLLAW